MSEALYICRYTINKQHLAGPGGVPWLHGDGNDARNVAKYVGLLKEETEDKAPHCIYLPSSKHRIIQKTCAHHFAFHILSVDL